MTRFLSITLLSGVLIVGGCTSSQSSEESANREGPQAPAFINSLTFYSSFDGARADKARGDDRLYSAASRSPADTAVAGLEEAGKVSILSDSGLFGGALQFTAKTNNVVFFKCERNLPYSSTDWTGTVSFWLKLDPSIDLEPGFCDPIQITDVNYNDAAIWVDFTSENPRDFRLGVIGDLDHWDPDGVGPTDNPEFDKRLVVVDEPPFSREQWTHVAITYNQLNGSGTSSLYLNGQIQGTMSPIRDPFTWDLSSANMYLGLNYVGLFDELSIYQSSLTAQEVNSLYRLDRSLKELL